MRLLLIAVLFAPGLFALDMKDVDRDTCRYVRLALLKDDVRKHFGLRIGDFESLDQAVRVDVKMDGALHLLILRLKTKAAGVLIRTTGKDDLAGAHTFFDVENVVTATPLLDGEFVRVDCRVGEDDLPVRSRIVRCKDSTPQMCVSFLSHEALTLENGRYVIDTQREFERGDNGLQIQETSQCRLDGKNVDGGLESNSTPLTSKPEGLIRGEPTVSCISVATHCSLARKLERDGLNEAALHHARAAKLRAALDKLAEDDTRRLEAQALAARLEARLRPVEVTRK